MRVNKLTVKDNSLTVSTTIEGEGMDEETIVSFLSGFINSERYEIIVNGVPIEASGL